MRHTVPLPETWEVATIDEVTSYVQRGKSPVYTEKSDLPVVNQKCIRWSCVDPQWLKFVHPDQWPQWGEERFLQPGDVLWNSTGTGTIGRAALFRGLTGYERAVVDSHVTILRTREYSPAFLHYWIMSPAVQAKIDRMQAGSTNQVELSRVEVLATEVVVPPCPEQHRIVEAIESYLTRLDNAVALLERVEQNLKRYRASVLKAAVEGRLVPTEAALARQEGREYEPASELLKRILAERKTRWIEDAAEKARAAGKPWTAEDSASTLEQERAKAAKQYKEPAAPDLSALQAQVGTSGLPDLPEGWCWAGPEQVSSGEQYAIGIGPFGSNLLVTDYTDSGVPLVFVRNIRAELFGTEGDHYISAEKAAELRPHWVEPGDVLITKMGEPPGDTCLYPPSRPTAVITADCIRLRLHPTLGSSKYIVYAVRSYIVRTQIAAITKGVAQKKVSLARFKGLAIPFPPIAEQLRLVSEVDRVNAVCEAVEREVRVNIVRGQRLRQSILKWAFEGKLVEQDPDDEPASALLERIRAERVATCADKPRARKRRGAE